MNKKQAFVLWKWHSWDDAMEWMLKWTYYFQPILWLRQTKGNKTVSIVNIKWIIFANSPLRDSIANYCFTTSIPGVYEYSYVQWLVGWLVGFEAYQPKSVYERFGWCNLDQQTFTKEFKSHWVPHAHGIVPHLKEKLRKLQSESVFGI